MSYVDHLKQTKTLIIDHAILSIFPLKTLSG